MAKNRYGAQARRIKLADNRTSNEIVYCSVAQCGNEAMVTYPRYKMDRYGLPYAQRHRCTEHWRLTYRNESAKLHAMLQSYGLA